MYQLLSLRELKSRKDRTCIWGPEMIRVGETYKREISTYDHDFQNHAWHHECFKAATDFWADNPDEDLFCAHEFKRGSSFEAK